MAVAGLELDEHRVDRDDDADQQREAAAYYRRRLAEPAVRPWTPGSEFEPVLLGPTWQVDSTGHWMLPELTGGWDVLGFLSVHLDPGSINRDDRFEFTLEQARFILWWYSVEVDCRWVFRDGCFQRVKGHGKDPLLAAISTNVLVGPDQPVDVDERTGVVTMAQARSSLVQLAAVTLDQTSTTMDMFPTMLSDATRAKLGIMPPGKEHLDARGGKSRLVAVTSNPKPLEGKRARLVGANETHLWTEANNGLAMDAVLRRNMRKNAAARVLRFTNAFAPGEESVAERDRNAFEAGDLKRFLYDSIEAPKKAELHRMHGEQVVPIVRGDSTWLTTEMFLEALEDPRDPASEKRRFWYNQVWATEESWLDPAAWRDIAPPRDPETGEPMGLMPLPGDKVVLFGDGSKSDDNTAIMGCRLDDGLVFFVGVWKRPANLTRQQQATWKVNRDEVDARVIEAMDTYKVIGFFFDPSDVLDEQGNSYWVPYCDIWHQRYGKKLLLKATREHSILWDMRTITHQKEFTTAAETFVADVERADFFHDGHPEVSRHVGNARANPGRYGVGLQKESRESPKKIDLAVCAVGARMMRRYVRNAGKKYAGRTGRVV